MTDDEISKEALTFRLQLKLYENGLYDVELEVIPCLYEYLKIYIRSVIRHMVRCKKKYDVICPVLKPVGKVDKEYDAETNKDSFKVKVVFDEDPFTVKELFECFKEFPHIVPREGIYYAHLQHIAEMVYDVRPKRVKFYGESFPTLEV